MRPMRVLVASAAISLLAGLVMSPPVAAAGPGALAVPSLVYADGEGSIHAADADGTNDRVILPEVESSTSETFYALPSVSPDGTRLVVTRFTLTLSQRIYGGLTVLDLATGARTQTASSLSRLQEFPHWSNDGKSVYYDVWDMVTKTTSLWRWSVDGGTAVRVANGTQPVDVSPSGQQLLVFSGVTATSGGVLAVRDLATGSVSVLSGATGAGWASWSPDGGRIALLSAFGKGSKLTTIAARGSAPTVVTTALPEAYRATWTSDGSGVVVELENTLERVDVSTGVRTVLVTVPGGAGMGHCVWSPSPATDATVPGATAITKVSRSATAVSLAWTNPADSDWSRTVVRRDGTIVAAGRISSASLTLPVSSAANLTVTAYDAFGNAAPAAPVVTAGVVAPTVNALVGTGAPFTVRWSAPGATAYTVRWSTMALTSTGWKLQPWKPWLSGTTDTSAVFGAGGIPAKVVPGTTYYVVVTPTVSASTTSTVVTSSAAYDQTAMTASSGWLTVRNSGAYLGSVASARVAGASRTFTVYTSAITLVGTRCATCGAVRIYLDGRLVRTVDTYSATAKVRQALWSSGSLGSIKRHVVKIVVVGTPHRPAVIIDAIAAKR